MPASNPFFTAAALCLAVCVGTASAEPIRWTYSSAGGEGTFDGVRIRLEGGPGPTMESAPGMFGYIAPVSRWGWEADRTDVLGTFGPVDVKVTLVDLGSGAAGQLVVPYFGSFDVSPTDDREVLVSDHSFTAELTLGGHVYYVEGEGGGGGLFVAAVPGVATPEPATAALAGLGLAGVVATRLRGRRRSGQR